MSWGSPMSSDGALRKSIRRVAAMSHDEIRVRATQEISKRWDLARCKVGIRAATISAAEPFLGGGHFFFQRQEVDDILKWLRANLPDAAEQIVRQADKVLRHRFDLLGYESVDYGEKIDWHRDAVHGKTAPRRPWYRVPYLDFNKVGDHKITWELNRHQHLVTLAKAYRLTGNSHYSDELFQQWYGWQTQNPYPVGINWASSLEVSFRSLAWLWVWHLVRGCKDTPTRFGQDVHAALFQNARHIERYLSTYFAPNTHLLGEAVGLLFIGTLCSKSNATRRWQNVGLRTITREAGRQVRPDGMHFEQSTYYHVYALDFFLHARILARTNRVPIPAEVDRAIEKMLRALSALNQAGRAPHFGDDDGGRVFDGRRNRREHMADPLAIGAALFDLDGFGRPSVIEELVWLLGTASADAISALPHVESNPKSFALDHSGIYAMAASSASTRQQLSIDAGPQGPGWAGHGHADALSVQLSLGGQELLVDPGTFTYVHVNGERGSFRETGAHNTVQVDGLSQAESAGPFKWNCLAHGKAEYWHSETAFDFFVGSHFGYRRLPNPVLHRRSIFYLKPGFWFIRDVVEGGGRHEAKVCWNFAPGILRLESDKAEFIKDAQVGLTLLCRTSRNSEMEATEGWYSAAYGKKERSPALRVRIQAELPVECGTALIAGEQRGACLELLANGTDVSAYQLTLGNERHQLIFGCEGKSWEFGRFAGDAQFACVSSSAFQPKQLVVCRGTLFNIGDERVFSSPHATAGMISLIKSFTPTRPSPRGVQGSSWASSSYREL